MTGELDHAVTYEQSAEFNWTVRAFELLCAGHLHGKAFATDGVVSSHVWGACPRCAHALDDRQVHTAVITGVGRSVNVYLEGQPDALLVDVACGCGRAHPDAPGEITGCGVSFRVELVLPQKPS